MSIKRHFVGLPDFNYQDGLQSIIQFILAKHASSRSPAPRSFLLRSHAAEQNVIVHKVYSHYNGTGSYNFIQNMLLFKSLD